ncbi:hypothetical protein FRC12_022181 [Ceratobasidium sp. 428]|nr:hypothetical protein FRC12_022181 [Ceratobasidium sp. 428]
MWTYLQDLKHNGAYDEAPTKGGSLALRCPACPRLGVNYEQTDIESGQEYLFNQMLSYDGSFQLTRKNKAHDEHNLCMSDGTKYWVKQDHYKAHLEANKDTAYKQSTRGGDCSNHRAANDTWVRQPGVAETGIGAVTCGRHTFYMPEGVVNFFKGERFAYTDFAILSVLFLLIEEGAFRIGVFYDIFCHWIKNFWSRLADIVLSGPALTQSMIFGGVGKYHIAGHTDNCAAQFSPNFLPGVGRIDAEGCERGWADLNLASRSTSEKGPGFRIESINAIMHDWNWRKLITMSMDNFNSLIRQLIHEDIVALILTKYAEATRMADEQEANWKDFNSRIHPDFRTVWEGIDIAPHYDTKTKKWTSPFISQAASATSMARALLKLNKESIGKDVDTETGYTAPTWISEGLEIEVQQKRLMNDLKAFGHDMTPRQALDCFNRRSTLSARIIRHRQSAALFLDVAPSNIYSSSSLAEETDGQPEHAVLLLPSQLGDELVLTERSQRVRRIERELRRVSSYRAINRVKLALIKKKSAIDAKNKVRGEIKRSRAQAAIDRITQRVDFACWEYNNSYNALLKLKIPKSDASVLQPMKSSNIDGVITILSTDRNLGEGYVDLPWFWLVSIDNEKPGGPAPTAAAVQKQVDEATKVEWFRGRERYKRWREEQCWLRREMASVILDFDSRASVWEKRSQTHSANLSPGYRSYCLRQRDAWQTLRDDALARGRSILTASPSIALCTRVNDMFPQHTDVSTN